LSAASWKILSGPGNDAHPARTFRPVYAFIHGGHGFATIPKKGIKKDLFQRPLYLDFVA
jgi:hypothetical protein